MNRIDPKQAFDTRETFVVGGVKMGRPFKIRRTSHYGVYVSKLSDAVRFYKDLLGFRISDVITGTKERPNKLPADYSAFDDSRGIFMNYGTDHHSFALFKAQVFKDLGRLGDTLNVQQLTWQVGSLAEVAEGFDWFQKMQLDIRRAGRDMPGSNWHAYLLDPENNQNEITYGMEQIGWNGRSKPLPMHVRKVENRAELPQISEYTEVMDATKLKVDFLDGYRDDERLPLEHSVGGVLLARPFKIVKIGPINLFCDDMDAMLEWYQVVMGFDVIEEVMYEGHKVVYLRATTDHHSLALFPMALRSKLGFKSDTPHMSMGIQVGSYEQLRAARDFLKSNGVTIRELPPELSPGMDHTFFAFDPDGYAMQFYWSMEQIGWEGKAKPAHLRRPVKAGVWPDTLDENSDSYLGEPFFGPYG